MTELDAFRQAKDNFFRQSPQSPLTAKQKRSFSGLSYFPENPSLRLEIPAQTTNPTGPVEMQTSTGETKTYSRLGRLHFQVEGQDAELTIFEDPNGLFLPFVDSLAGSATYPAGRYLEPEPLPNGCFLVDFNYAYNPYCAYSAQWSCPLTPFENRLRVAIRAGEMLFDGSH